MTAPAEQSPAGLLRQRLVELERLRALVDHELQATRAKLRRLGLANSSAHRTITPPGVDSKAVRAWGREHGWKLGDRGRMPADLIAAYMARGRR